MEDLDAELLAVTDGQKRAKRTARSSTSDSDGEFDGIADSDGGDDDDDEMLDDTGGLDDDDDDDDDDDEYGLDEDDDEFTAKRSRKKKATKPSRSKKTTSRSKSTKRRPRSSEKRKSRGKHDVPLSDNDDDEFVYEFDQYGYGDAADQEKLARMNEVDRELILEERIEARNREYMLWKKRREMTRSEARERVGEKRGARSSGRTKQSSKSDALQALAEDKRKKSARPVNLDVSDADSEPDPSSRRQTAMEVERKERRTEQKSEPDDSGPSLKYTDLVTQDESGARMTTPLFLRRDAMIKLSQEPFFHRAVVGLFCRVRALGRSDDSYLLCRIVDAVISRVYELGNGLVSNWSLILQTGGQRKPFEIRLTSGSAPSEAEFDHYCRRAERDDVELPRREDVKKLLMRSQDLIFSRNGIPTDAELKKHVANMELLYPSRVNWTQKLTEAKTALDIKKQDLSTARVRRDVNAVEKLEEEVEELEKRVAEVQRMEEKYVLKPVKTNAEVFHSLAKRNMALNNTTERLAANRESLESRANGTNPFARFDTTGQSYFSIPSRDSKEPSKDKKSVPLNSFSDWRSLASTWDPSGKRRKVGERALDTAYDTPLSSLHVFEGEEEYKGRRRGFRLLPAMVDAAYSGQVCAKSNLPPGAKILSLEEWSRQRAG